MQTLEREDAMPDERKDSIAAGIAAPEESAIGQEADRDRREKLIRTPPEARPESGMGGTSDSDSPADAAAVDEVLRSTQQSD